MILSLSAIHNPRCRLDVGWRRALTRRRRRRRASDWEEDELDLPRPTSLLSAWTRIKQCVMQHSDFLHVPISQHNFTRRLLPALLHQPSRRFVYVWILPELGYRRSSGTDSKCVASVYTYVFG